MDFFLSSFATSLLLLLVTGCAHEPPLEVAADGATDARRTDAGEDPDVEPPTDAGSRVDVGPDARAVETAGHISLGAHRVAMILFNFENDTSRVGTVDAARRAMFTGRQSVNALYREASFGKFWLEGAEREDGDVFGWYTIPFDDTPCQRDEWAAAARSFAAADGFDVTQYDYVAYIHPWGPCGGQGRPDWSPPSTFFRRFNLRSAGHEFGHAIGFAHSAGLACTSDGRTRVTLGGDCDVVEYADTSDIMGSAFAGHVNQVHKGRMGWLEASNTHTLTADGSYDVLPIEVPTDGVQVLRIPRVVDDRDGRVIQYLYIEHRQDFGFDEIPAGSPLSDGVMLRLGAPYDGSLMRTLLLDATPDTPEFEDAALRVGARFVDESTGITVQAVDVGGGRATVAVDVGEARRCERAAPTLTITPPVQAGPAGSRSRYELRVENEDGEGCFMSTFIVSIRDLPAGWAQEGLSGLEASLAPGESAGRALNVTAPEGAEPGVYVATFDAVLGEDPSFTASATLTFEVL